MARPRSGSLYWTKSGWRARLTVDIDGEAVQKSFDLETHDRAAAKAKLRRLLRENAPAPTTEEAKRVDTFKEAAERIVGDSVIRSKKTRIERLRLHVYPAIGGKAVTKIVAGDIRAILKDLADAGASKQSCIHVRNDVSAVLGELWRLDELPENVCQKVQIPKHAKVDKRERAVLTDEELVRYLGWQHPREKLRSAVLERQTMACVSRVFGGIRWGDIRALRWEAFETEQGRFSYGWAPRKKTARPQALIVPEVLRPILRDWWERKGRPSAGVIFPARRGKRAGEERRPSSVANALRRDLARAFGIERPVTVERVRKNGRPDSVQTWEEARPMTARERELLTETEYTRPVEFHSFRRAFKQALAEAGVELQTAMTLSGATDAATHRRYLTNTSKAREIPLAALPDLTVSASLMQKPFEAENENGEIPSGRDRFRTCDIRLVSQNPESEVAGFLPVPMGDDSPTLADQSAPGVPMQELDAETIAAYLAAFGSGLAFVTEGGDA
jgi:integrase